MCICEGSVSEWGAISVGDVSCVRLCEWGEGCLCEVVCICVHV